MHVFRVVVLVVVGLAAVANAYGGPPKKKVYFPEKYGSVIEEENLEKGSDLSDGGKIPKDVLYVKGQPVESGEDKGEENYGEIKKTNEAKKVEEKTESFDLGSEYGNAKPVLGGGEPSYKEVKNVKKFDYDGQSAGKFGSENEEEKKIEKGDKFGNNYGSNDRGDEKEIKKYVDYGKDGKASTLGGDFGGDKIGEGKHEETIIDPEGAKDDYRHGWTGGYLPEAPKGGYGAAESIGPKQRQGVGGFGDAIGGGLGGIIGGGVGGMNYDETVGRESAVPKKVAYGGGFDEEVKKTIKESGYDQKSAYQPKEVYEPKEIYEPKEVYEPKESYKPKEVYEPKESYKPKEVYEPKESYKPKEVYEPKESYKPKEVYEPKESYKPKEADEPKEVYEPKKSYEPKEVYEPKKSYEPKEVYEPKKSYEPKDEYKPKDGSYDKEILEKPKTYEDFIGNKKNFYDDKEIKSIIEQPVYEPKPGMPITTLSTPVCNKMMDNLLNKLQPVFAGHLKKMPLSHLSPISIGGWARVRLREGKFDRIGKICRGGDFEVVPQGETVKIRGTIRVPRPAAKFCADAYLYDRVNVRNRNLMFCANDASFRMQLIVDRRAKTLDVQELEPIGVNGFHVEDEKGRRDSALPWPFSKIRGGALFKQRKQFLSTLQHKLCNDFRQMLTKPEIQEEIIRLV